jgi:hypothetical protein
MHGEVDKMVTPEFYIDMIQSSKRLMTDRIYTDPVVNKACHSFMDAQTDFARMLTKNFFDLSKYSADCLGKVVFPKGN